MSDAICSIFRCFGGVVDAEKIQSGDEVARGRSATSACSSFSEDRAYRKLQLYGVVVEPRQGGAGCVRTAHFLNGFGALLMLSVGHSQNSNQTQHIIANASSDIMLQTVTYNQEIGTRECALSNIRVDSKHI